MLARILAAKRADIAALRSARLPSPPASLRPVELARATGDPLRLIAEIKRRSPSAGTGQAGTSGTLAALMPRLAR